MNARIFIAALVAAPLIGGSAVSAQTIPAGTASIQSAQRGILSYAIQDSVAEIQLCQLALQKSQNPAVRTFAQTMIADHTKMVDQAVALAHSTGNADAAEVKPADDGMVRLAYLSRYSGHTFDEDFMRLQVSDHTDDIGVFRNAAETLGSAPVGSFAESTLPQLEQHLRLAEAARDAVAEHSAS